MRISRETRTVCAIVLFPMWLIACKTIVQDGEGDNAVSNSCAAGCEQQHPLGLKSYQNVMAICVCETCDNNCTKSVCGRKEPPSDACLPCVQDSLGDTCNQFGLFGSCLEEVDCSALVDCLLACDPQAK